MGNDTRRGQLIEAKEKGRSEGGREAKEGPRLAEAAPSLAAASPSRGRRGEGGLSRSVPPRRTRPRSSRPRAPPGGAAVWSETISSAGRSGRTRAAVGHDTVDEANRRGRHPLGAATGPKHEKILEAEELVAIRDGLGEDGSHHRRGVARPRLEARDTTQALVALETSAVLSAHTSRPARGRKAYSLSRRRGAHRQGRHRKLRDARPRYWSPSRRERILRPGSAYATAALAEAIGMPRRQGDATGGRRRKEIEALANGAGRAEMAELERDLANLRAEAKKGGAAVYRWRNRDPTRRRRSAR